MDSRRPGADRQAAPGTPLNGQEPVPPARPRRVGLLLAVAVFVIAVDVISKAIVVAKMPGHAPIRLLGGLLTITLTRNGGAAFSIGTSMTIVFTAIALGVIVYILRAARNLRSVGWAIALGLLLGGATGNLLDRIFRAPGLFQGHVVDWIELPHWPVFNLADSSIVCAGVLVVLLALRGIRLDGTRAAQESCMTAPGERQVAVPDGLDGERLDAALARMFGLSRSRAAELIGDGMVLIDGRTASKSDRVLAGDPLQVTLPAPRPAEPPRPVDGLIVLYEDDDIVVVDKPRGVAAHPTPGWSGPTVTGGLIAAGHTVATSGAAERQGVVHRLDANTTGVMVVAKSERAYSALKRAFRERTVDKRYHALVQGHPDPLRGTVDAPIGRHPVRRRPVRGGQRRPPERDPLRHAGSLPGRQPGLGAPGNRPDPPDPGAHGRAAAPVRGRPALRRRPGAGRPARPDAASGCTRSAWRSRTPPMAVRSPSPATTRPTWPAPWTSCEPKADLDGDR